MSFVPNQSWPLAIHASNPRQMCRAVGSVTGASNEAIEISLLAQPTGCDNVLSLKGAEAKQAKDTIGQYLAENVAVDVYWGPKGEVKVERRTKF